MLRYAFFILGRVLSVTDQANFKLAMQETREPSAYLEMSFNQRENKALDILNQVPKDCQALRIITVPNLCIRAEFRRLKLLFLVSNLDL